MTVPLIATQSEFLSPWHAYRRPCPSPSHRVRPPSLAPLCPAQAQQWQTPEEPRLCGRTVYLQE